MKTPPVDTKKILRDYIDSHGDVRPSIYVLCDEIDRLRRALEYSGPCVCIAGEPAQCPKHRALEADPVVTP